MKIFITSELRNLGNTVIVVEHDADVIKMADYIVDIGFKWNKKEYRIQFLPDSTTDDQASAYRHRYQTLYRRLEEGDGGR